MSEASLRNSRVFGGLGSDPTRALSRLLHRLTLSEGEVLFREGEIGEASYLVCEGEILIFEERPGVGEIERAVLGPGELFGELALFGSGRRSAGAKARTRAVVGELEQDAFLEIVRAWPDVALALLRVQTERFLDLERKYRRLSGER